MKLTYITLLAFSWAVAGLKAQDYAFSIYDQTPSLSNPAFIGLGGEARLGLQYRYQPLETGDNFNTSAIFLEYPLYRKADRSNQFGFGVTLLNDNQANFLKTNGMVGSLAYHLPLGKSYLSLALQGGFFQSRLDLGNFITDNQIRGGTFDPDALANENIDQQRVGFAVFSPSLLWSQQDEQHRTQAFLGLSAFNINRPNIAFNDITENTLPLNWTTVGGYRVFHNDKVAFIPNFRWINRLGFNHVSLGTWFDYYLTKEEHKQTETSIRLGAWYNTNEALVMSLSWQQPRYYIAFSYDLPSAASQSNFLGNGALEFSVGFKFPRKPAEKPIKIDEEILDTSVVALEEVPPPKEETRSPERIEKKEEIIVEDTTTIIPHPDPILTQPLDNRVDTLVTPLGIKIDTVLLVNRQVIAFRSFHVSFGLGKINLNDTSEETLYYLADLMKRYPKTKIEVRGYTCDLGSEANNLILSEKRADEVKEYLLRRGVKPEQIKTIGLGENHPVVPNVNEYYRQQNRRVEVESIK